MATRSMVVLNAPHGVSIYLYRHWDGYPACAGVALWKALTTTKGGSADVARALLALTEETGKPYELADWGPSQQGDLEHVYVCGGKRYEGTNGGFWTITHHARGASNWNGSDDDYTAWPSQRYDVNTFGAFVQHELELMKKRAEAMRSQAVDKALRSQLI